VVGDKLYGVDAGLYLRFCNATLTDDDLRRLRLDRQALHAAWLRIRHPVTRQPLEMEAPLPADLKALADGMR
jgi:23S rRNA pseudouridine1911/1915/1917 synthase